IDHRLLAPILEQINNYDEPLCVALLPDHPTPVKLRTHTADPIPFCIYYPGIEPDIVQTFDEVACKNGSYGLLREGEFIVEFMKQKGK
ncbi:MAG: phosphoglycerate mutase, partial [Clostridia bacterium]|nr:phosphoglycerate mutase [Clostridia bacterium]